MRQPRAPLPCHRCSPTLRTVSALSRQKTPAEQACGESTRFVANQLQNSKTRPKPCFEWKPIIIPVSIRSPCGQCFQGPLHRQVCVNVSPTIAVSIFGPSSRRQARLRRRIVAEDNQAPSISQLCTDSLPIVFRQFMEKHHSPWSYQLDARPLAMIQR